MFFLEIHCNEYLANTAGSVTGIILHWCIIRIHLTIPSQHCWIGHRDHPHPPLVYYTHTLNKMGNWFLTVIDISKGSELCEFASQVSAILAKL